MKNATVNFDIEHMKTALPAFVREKARKAGSNVVYMRDGLLIKENPRTGEKIVIKCLDNTKK